MKLDIEFNSGAQLPMDAIPPLAQAAEDSGFDCAWGGEANNKDPTVMLAAVAAVTSRLKVGTAVYHMLGRTPVSMALHAAGLDELSGGRFLFGLGISNPTIANWHGVAFDKPLRRIREYLEIVQGALRGDKLDYEGTFYSARGFKLAFKPSPRGVPVYLAAFGPRMSRLAGRLSDGVLINMANPPEIRRIAENVHEGARLAGKDPDALEIVCKVRCCVARDRQAARQALGRILTYYALADYYRDLLTRMGFGEEVTAIRDAWRASGFHAAAAQVTDRLFDGLPLVAGASVDEVLDKVRAYGEAGATRVILPYVPCTEDVVGEIRAFIEAFGRR
ncbi:MAG: LLM class flavin-dependent oxidoreductase [Deltaproteobacteria bacterium]|nr:LLM class flavin-dependent oxidoreductase [Deltaproteobacteria bacterium]